jgi:hypothetical protein
MEALDGAVLAHIAHVVCTRERIAELRALVHKEGMEVIGDLAKVWRRLILEDYEVGRMYVKAMVDKVVVDDTAITVTARASIGKVEAEVSKLLRDGEDD